MSRPIPLILATILTLATAGFSALALLKNGIYINTFEGDAFHLMDIMTRMEMGQRPHLDFQTPIGGLAFWPIAPFWGFGAGRAFAAGQLLVAVLLLPAIIRVAQSRLARGWAEFFGLSLIVMVTALVYGGDTANVSVSMHYNRWAWAIAAVAVLAAVLPARKGGGAAIDGVIIGLCFAALALLKATYFLALLPGVVVALAVRGAYRDIAWAAAGGVTVALIVAVTQGFGFYAAYVSDLQAVAAADLRNFPGLPFTEILTGPRFLVATLLGLAAIALLRRSEAPGMGLALLVLLPGFFYVTFQNFGNDPIWLLPLGLIAVSAAGAPSLKVVGIAALLVGAPPFITMATSTLRHFALKTDGYVAIVPRVPVPRGSIYTTQIRAQTANGTVALDDDAFGLSALNGLVERPNRVEFAGAILPDCQITAGYVGWYAETAAALNNSDLPRDATLFVADVLSVQWLFALKAPLPGGTPWYYDGLPGIDAASHVLVPLCAVQPAARTEALSELTGSGLDLTELQSTPLYRLFEIQR